MFKLVAKMKTFCSSKYST